MYLQRLNAVLCAARSMYRVWLQAEHVVLVSIFISKSIIISEHHLSAINTFVLMYIVRVTEF